jgi:hypothetical protein
MEQPTMTRASTKAASILLGFALGCTDQPLPDEESGTISDTALSEECGLIEAPEFPGCLVLMYDDLIGHGRRPDEHRSLYDSNGLLRGYDYRSAITADDFMVCGYDWSTSGNPLEEWCVGQSVYTYRWDYDAQGNPTSKYYDGASDGVIDKAWDYIVDENGSVTEEALDQDVDGAYDSYTWYVYDEEGRLVADSWDYQGDGTVDYGRTYTYNSAGLLESVLTDSNADGVDDDELSYTYDELGNILVIDEDENLDGQWDIRSEYAYADCKLVGINEKEISGISNSVDYSYDEQDRLFREDYDWDNDGGRDAFAAWEYTCP